MGNRNDSAKGQKKWKFLRPRLYKAVHNSGKKNYLFAESHASAQSTAMFYSFFGTCKHNNVDPFTCLKWVLEIIPDFIPQTN